MGNRVKQLLEKEGISQVQLARELKVTKQAVNKTIHLKSGSRRIRGYICIRLNKRYEDLWPLVA